MSTALSIGTQTVGSASILKEGLKTYKGIDQATLKNIAAVLELGDLLRTSFGPCGQNKLIPSSVTSNLHVTSDAKTIVHEAGVFHPAAKLLAEAAMRQSGDFGDGGATLVLFCSALLNHAAELIQEGVRPTHIIEGFDLCMQECLATIDSMVIDRVVPNWTEGSVKALSAQLKALMLTSVMSKASTRLEAESLATLASEAMAIAVPFDRPSHFDLDNVRIVKILGGSLGKSEAMRGLVLNRLAETQRKQLTGPNIKVAVYSCELDLAKTETKGTVLLSSAEQMRKLAGDEEAELFAQFKGIADTGASVVITQDRIGDLALHVLDRLGLCALRVASKFDIRRICRATGASVLTSLTPPPNASALGTINSVQVKEIGSDLVTVFDVAGAISTIILRGSSLSVMEDHERCILGALAVCKAVLVAQTNVDSPEKGHPAGSMVSGAGACEAELAKRLRTFVGERQRDLNFPVLPLRAMQVFSDALMAIPAALAENAGHNALEAVTQLERAHTEGRMGAGIGILSVVEDTPARDLLKVKREAIRMAIKIAALILSVEQIFMSKPVTGAPSAQRPAHVDMD